MARILGLDIGEKRIGVALSDESQLVARPLMTIERKSKRDDFQRLAQLIAAHDVERVIVGMPWTLRSEEGRQAQRVRRYVEAMAAVIHTPMTFQDERYTSAEAEDRLAGSPRKLRLKSDIDAAAAAIILQDYLNNPRTTGA